MSHPLLMLDIDIKVANQNKAAVGANAFFSSAKFTGLHVSLHDVDAVFLVEGNTGNFVKTNDVVLANQTSLSI